MQADREGHGGGYALRGLSGACAIRRTFAHWSNSRTILRVRARQVERQEDPNESNFVGVFFFVCHREPMPADAAAAKDEEKEQPGDAALERLSAKLAKAAGSADAAGLKEIVQE